LLREKAFSEHTAPFDALVIGVEGEAEIPDLGAKAPATGGRDDNNAGESASCSASSQ
jgi:hypothetical protein